MAQLGDTICAISTAIGGGIGVIRISGPDAEKILRKIFRPCPAGLTSHQLYFGKIFAARSNSPDEEVDEVLAVLMRGPHSYTGEDVVEIQGHGGRYVLGRLLEVVRDAGARSAEPGEFTRRAFVAGRMDLSRAEAVAQLVEARSRRAFESARALLGGALEQPIRTARDGIVDVLVDLEGDIDFPDEQVDARTSAELAGALDKVDAQLAQLAARTRVASGTPEVFLVGRTNAGKSSLLNFLVGHERALVDSGAGTTRDLVEAELDAEGLTLRVVDTAGERLAAQGSVEQRGIELARKRRQGAALCLLVVDGGVGFQTTEQRLWEELSGQRRLIVWNKRDLAAPAKLPDGASVVEVSALTGQGRDDLVTALLSGLNEDDEEDRLAISDRQVEALAAARSALVRARSALLDDKLPEIASVELRQALEELGRITGENVDPQILDTLFSRFCIGK